jgi:hypothetical protein
MPPEYFSDREQGVRPRTEEEIKPVVWNAIAAIVQSLVEDGSFGMSFPCICADGSDVAGTNAAMWQHVLQAEHPGINLPFHNLPFQARETPTTLAILDLVEFAHSHVAKPIPGEYHSFFHHHHLTFDQLAGQAAFRVRVNRLLARNGLAYELRDDGQVVRLAAPFLRETLLATAFQSGDTTLDAMLESARAKFLDPNPEVRKEALEKLWDAWERLKTIESGADKKAQVKALLDKAAKEPDFRALLEREARELTETGNAFLIRHSETNRTPIEATAHVDYLFHRLFALIWMLLKARGT